MRRLFARLRYRLWLWRFLRPRSECTGFGSQPPSLVLRLRWQGTDVLACIGRRVLERGVLLFPKKFGEGSMFSNDRGKLS